MDELPSGPKRSAADAAASGSSAGDASYFPCLALADLPTPGFALDRDGRFTLANPPCARVFGLKSADELCGRPFLDFVHSRDRDAARRALRRMLAGEAVPGVPVRTAHGDGEHVCLALAGGAVVHEGAVVGLQAFLTDISEIARLAEALQREAEHLQTLTESSEDVISRHAAGGEILYVSPSCERLLGYTAEELTGGQAIGHIHPDDRERIAEAYRVAREQDRAVCVEFRVLTRDGRTRWVESRTRPVAPGQHGDAAETVAVARDITERKHVEEALRESEARYRMLYENVPLGISTVSLTDYRILTANPALCRMVGYSEEALCQMTIRDVTLPEDFAVDEEVARNRLAGDDSPNAREKRVRRADGTLVWLRGISVKLPDIEGHPPRALAIVEDVTERRARDEELRDREARYRALYENSPLGIVLVDHRTLDILEVNAAFCRLVGYSEAELRGRHILDLTHPDDAHVTRNAWKQRLDGSTGQFCYDKRYLRRDGRAVWTRVTWDVVHTHDGHPAQGIAVVADITEERERDRERRQLETRMQQAQKLESLGMLAGGIAHDFNNLLMAILGNVELVAQDLPGDAPVRPLLDEISLGAQRAAELSRQMLAYSGRGAYEKTDVALNDLVMSLRGVFDASFPSDTRLLMELARQLPPVHGDRAALTQLVLGLMTNAAESLPQGRGRVVVRTFAQRFDEDELQCPYLYEHFPPGDYVVLEVADTGCGMDEASLARVFDPFFSTKFTGRGLGMAAALGIVRSHQGLVQVESEPGAGTLVRVLFPVRTAAPETPRAPGSAETHGQGVILLADDDDMVRRVTRRLLERRGFTVVEAADGVEAVQAAEQRDQKLHCALLDLSMPRMTGDEAALRIRELRPGLPIILSSGYAENEVQLRFAHHGFDAFLEKPYRSDQVLDLIRRVLREHAKGN